MKKINPENWTDEEVKTWYESGQWLEGWNVEPDAAINQRSLAINYHKNPQRWKQAFKFLKENDLQKLPVEKYELDGTNLFIAVDEYESKDKSNTKYEAHKNYIDIQYIISGEEQMGLSTIDKMNALEAYNAEKDLVFYSYEGGRYLKATPKNVLIFFPEDMHRPGIKLNKAVPIKKAVVKIRI